MDTSNDEGDIVSEPKKENSCNYGFFAKDGDALVSLDMVEMDFFMSTSVESTVKDVISLFEEVLPDWNLEHYTKLNVPASSKWAFFTNHLWGGGFHVSVGAWQKYDKEDKFWIVLPYMRLRFNPNKHKGDALYRGFRSLVSESSLDGQLVKYDIAFDFATALSSVIVHSRKERGLYKGTLYYGQRNMHGRLKVYDKGKELGLQTPLTRVEWTFRTDRKRVFDDVFVLSGERLQVVDALSRTCRNYVNMLLCLLSHGESLEPFLSSVDFRTRKKIEPYVVGTGIQLRVSEPLVDSILDSFSREFNVTWAFNFVKLAFSPDGFKSRSDSESLDEEKELSYDQLALEGV